MSAWAPITANASTSTKIAGFANEATRQLMKTDRLSLNHRAFYMGAVLFGRRNGETPSSNYIFQVGACHLQRLLDMFVAQVTC